MTINPKVVDVSHYDRVSNLQATRAAGIVGIIAKATQGLGYTDDKYISVRTMAKAAGLEFGAYCFFEHGNVAAEVDKFLSFAMPDDRTLLALDHEPYGAKTPTLDDAHEFCQRVFEKVGRRPIIYSGNLIKEQLGSRVDPFFGAHRLWLAQYSSRPVTQRSWAAPWLWQYTGDGSGLPPHTMPGISIAGGLDISSFEGSDEQLRAEWVLDLPAHIATTDVPNHDVKWLQHALNVLGANPILAEDGDIGAKTIAAIRAFQVANGLKNDGSAGPLTLAAIEKLLPAATV